MRPQALTSVLVSLSLAAPAFADAGIKAVERTFLERTAIAAADETCNLFSEGERTALRSGLYQSEGELLRAGRSRREIAELAFDVRTHAKSLGCDHPSVMEVAGTIRSSYRQFAKTTFLEYPAKNSTWGASRSEHDAWAVKQTDKKSGAMFGLRRTDKNDPSKFTLVLALPYDDKPPSVVQINLRDAKKLADPWLGGLSGAKELSVPARSVSRPEWAGKMEEWEDNVGDWFNVYYFSRSAVERLELLDPREAIEIEVTPNVRVKDAKPVKIVFEVGDFRAARAFAMIPPAPVSQLAAAAQPAAPAKDEHH